MQKETTSEKLFKTLCSMRGVTCNRILEGDKLSPDFEIELGNQWVMVEVKEFEPVEHEEGPHAPPVIGAYIAEKIRRKIDEGYPQLKAKAHDGQPCLLILYDNMGPLHHINAFTISTAMYGEYGGRLALTKDPREPAQFVFEGFMGNRRTTRGECRRLSAIGVLKGAASDVPRLKIFHNRFAVFPVEPVAMAQLADRQLQHPNPHERDFTHWKPVDVSPDPVSPTAHNQYQQNRHSTATTKSSL